MRNEPGNTPNSQQPEALPQATMPMAPIFSVENYAKLAIDLANGTATPEQVKESYYAACLDTFNLDQDIEFGFNDLQVRQTLAAIGIADANEHTHEQNVQRLVGLIQDSHALHFAPASTVYASNETATSWIVENLTQEHIVEFSSKRFELTPTVHTRITTLGIIADLSLDPAQS